MKKILASLLIIVTAAFGIVNFSAPAVAAPIDCNPTSVLGINRWCNGLDDDFKKDGGLRDFVVGLAINILDMLLGIANYVAVIMVMWGGFLYLTAGSNEQQVGKGKKVITNAAIGVAIMTAASAIIGIVREVSDWFSSSAKAGFVSIANKAFIWAGLLAILMIIWGAVQYSTSAGDPGKIQKSKKTIINSVIGVVIVILAASIVNLVIKQTEGL
ncbi:MAG: hypothetical protein Q4A96_03950 [Candidatus Saccharibacteria bacterium]|nr:hypothetical protein [Candidatus Saccharibacteria bacterium]